MEYSFCTKKLCSKECANLANSIFAHKRNVKNKALQTGRKKYYGSNWRAQRNKRREIDNYTCQRCGVTEKEYGKELSVHHVEPFVYFDSYLEANKTDNLLSLCEPCHRKEHSGDEHHYNFDKSKIKYEKVLSPTYIKQINNAKKIVNLLLTTDMSMRQISMNLGVCHGTIRNIYHGKTWKSLYDKPIKYIRPRKHWKKNN